MNDEDLKRAEELTLRTHQLNTTGYTYSYERADELRHSPDHLLLIAGLDDVFGTMARSVSASWSWVRSTGPSSSS